MKKSVLITGVPGTGKTTLSRKLTEMGYKAYDIEGIPGLFAAADRKTKQSVKDHDGADFKYWVCDKTKLESLIAGENSPITFYCGAASNLDEIMPLFDLVVLLTVSPDTMRQRLSSRTNNDFGRTTHVQDWIVSWKDSWEDMIKKNATLVISTDKGIEHVAEEIIKEGAKF